VPIDTTTAAPGRWERAWLLLFGPNARERRADPSPRVTAAALLLILTAAAVLRVHRLGDLPRGFYCDEAALGYNAYSLLRTGRDENGTLLPLYVWSFDTSYKNPVFVYSAIAPIAAFGLSEFAVRLTSAVYGTATVLGLFYLGRALMGPLVGLVAAALLAVCPWHWHFSRIGFELISFPCLFVAATLQLVHFLHGRRRLVLAALLFGATVYTYAIAKLFVPLFLAGAVLLYWRVFAARGRETLRALGVLVLSVAPVVVFDLTHRARASAYFRETTMLQPGEPPVQLLWRFLAHYEQFFSVDFLFTRGDYILRHAVQEHGELYWSFLPLLALGVMTGVCRLDRVLLLPLWWLIVYPVAPALMTEIPSASRGIIGAPVFCVLAAIGAGVLLRGPTQLPGPRWIAAVLQLAMVAGGLGVLLPEVGRYWSLYTQEYPRYAAKSYAGFQVGHRETVRYFLTHRADYDRMMISLRDNNQPQIFLLFYAAFSPERFQAGGLEALEADTKMTVGVPEELDPTVEYDRLLIATTEEETAIFADHTVQHTVWAPDGSPAFVLTAVRRVKEFAGTWWVLGPYPATAPLPLPGADAPQPAEGFDWHRIERPPTANQHASVELGHLWDMQSLQCAWAVNRLHSDQKQFVRVFAGLDDLGEIWVNGRRVPLLRRAPTGPPVADAVLGTVELRTGANAVAIKTCATGAGWRFYFRLTAADGGLTRGVRWER
jgi:4-amino-4-deoxy-L-arabinose transferase-like glycosyltransferase